MSGHLTILDDCIGEGLVRYLKEKQTLLKVTFYDKVSSVQSKTTLETSDIFIIGQNFRPFITLCAGVGQVFLLGEEADENYPVLNPYQPADALLREMNHQLLEKQIFIPGLKIHAHKKRVILFCSTHESVWQTRIAYAYSKHVAERERVLYISFHGFDGFFSNEKVELDLGDLFFYIHQKKIPFWQIITEVAQSDGFLNLIYPVRNPLDLEDIKKEDCHMLMERLLQESECDRIVLDLSKTASFLSCFYSWCHKCYLIGDNSDSSKRGSLQFASFLKQSTSRTESDLLKNVKLASKNIDADAIAFELIHGEEKEWNM